MGEMNIGYRGFQEVRRPLAGVIDRLAAFAPPDLSDVMKGSYSLDPRIRAMYSPMARMTGPAVTVSVPRGAFNVIKVAMEQTRPGDVLVINACGIESFAVWGGNVSKGMKRRGIAGVLIDGAARDIEESREVNFPVFARSVATGSPPLDGPGEVNMPVACGGVVVRPGDIVVADLSGIVVIPGDAAEWVLQQVKLLKDGHRRVQPTLEGGEVVNIAGIISRLRDDGFELHSVPENVG